MKKTKIVCTMGPASMEVETIKRMITAGMDLVRLNFSHGSHEELRQTIANVRLASKETGKPVGILADHQGPKIRIGTLPEPVLLKEGDTVRLVAGEAGAALGDGAEGPGGLVIGRPRLGHLGNGRQHGELLLGNPGGRLRVEARGTVLHGVEPVAGELGPGGQVGMVDPFGREAFDRMAEQRGDMGVHAPL